MNILERLSDVDDPTGWGEFLGHYEIAWYLAQELCNDALVVYRKISLGEV